MLANLNIVLLLILLNKINIIKPKKNQIICFTKLLLYKLLKYLALYISKKLIIIIIRKGIKKINLLSKIFFIKIVCVFFSYLS